MKKLVLISIAVVVLAACATMNRPTATATLAPTTGSTATGSAKFVQLADGAVEVTVDVTGVTPGVHGFHVHEGSQCGADGMAAGGHFNPTSTPHGAPHDDAKHAGDFGNVTADGNGRVQVKFTTRSVTVESGASSVVGHAVVLHANPDDLKTQPTGNAGGRIACGVAEKN